VQLADPVGLVFTALRERALPQIKDLL